MVTKPQSFHHLLQEQTRPDFEEGDATLKAVDLFGGCGGLSLGIAQACRDFEAALDIRLAADFDADALAVFATNFPKATVALEDLGKCLNGQPGEPLTTEECRVFEGVGAVQILVAGPPCQGHSDLNNHTRRDDPKNRLYLKVARAAEILAPRVVLIENVPSVMHDKNQAMQKTSLLLGARGYRVANLVVRLDKLGIPQRRKRHVLLATHDSIGLEPTSVLNSVAESQAEEHNLRWAIGDLADIANGNGVDQAPKASATNRERMRWLLEHDEYDLPNSERPLCHQNDGHTYLSMYGRLDWEKPAQTITSGFGSIGQGRYMHPDQMRALTPHEAARIQGFPDYFRFAPLPSRASLATMIANAVPPELARRIVREVLPSLLQQ